MGSISATLRKFLDIATDKVFWLMGVLHVPERICRKSPRDIVLMYHSVSPDLLDYQYNVDPDSFRQQMCFLLDHYEVVSLGDILYLPNQGKTRVAITFDDAFLNFYQHAFPIIKDLHVPVTNFVPTGFIESGTTMLPGQKHLTWSQMRSMTETGFVHFESHSHTHNHAVSLSKDEFKSDLLKSKHLIQDNLNYNPRYFAYPGGKHSFDTNQIVAELGFERILTSEKRFVSDKYAVGRISIEKKHSLYLFRAELAGLAETVYKLRKTITGNIRIQKKNHQKIAEEK